MKSSTAESSPVWADIFLLFLRRHRVLHCFIRNFLEVRFNPIPLDKFLKITGPDSYVTSAFIWNSTPEGHEYWRKLGDKWSGIVSGFKLRN